MRKGTGGLVAKSDNFDRVMILLFLQSRTEEVGGSLMSQRMGEQGEPIASR